MKRILLFVLLGISTTIAIAQTTWTGLGTNTNWNNTDNWDTNLVPAATDDVIVPTGFTVILNVAGTVKSIDVQGTSTFDVNSNLTFTEPSVFGTNTTINWSTGTINGLGSTLTNQGELNLTGNNGKTIANGTTLNNEGVINITSAGDLFLTGASALLNNQIGGVIDLQFDGGNITWAGASGVINNSGMIKKTASIGEAQIITILNNNNGTIQVEEGVLSFQSSPKNFTGGIYNVFSGATLDWDIPVTISGSLVGTLDGNMNWNNNIIVVAGDVADLNFTENFNWAGGALIGGGTLTNNGSIELIGNLSKTISGGTTVENLGSIAITSAGDLFISGANASLNNEEGAILDLQFDGGNITWSSASGVINNSGMIKKTVSTGEAQIITTINNTNGTIQVEEGVLSFQSSPKNFAGGTYNVFSGATLDWDTQVTISGSLGGTLEGNMNWNNNIIVVAGDVADLNFTENFNWAGGSISGGGTLTNNGSIELISNLSKTISGDTTLENLGNIAITSAGDLFISGANTSLNNEEGAILDLQFDGGNITWSSASGVINNSGMIKKTVSTGEAQIITILNNSNGTIQVEEGVLSFQSSPKNFTGGIYNVFSDGTLDWDIQVTISGSLGGTLDGNMNWNNTIIVADGDVADLNFTENFNWVGGTLSGGGTLTNNGSISLTGNLAKTISGETILNNIGTIAITSAGDLFISGAGTTINNQIDGIIDLQFDGGNITWAGASGVINNSGFISRSTSSGNVQIFVELHNSGIIEVISGELEHTGSAQFTNEENGIVRGIGVFDLPAITNYTNNGTFAPGLSPGTLSVQGDFKSTATSGLDIELNGLTPDTEHDVLAITGTNNVFEGTVNVTMGFEGTIGDTFIIATTSGTIATANLQSPIENVDFDGKRYTFEVSYPDNNKVVLTITDKLDILPPDIITQDITVQLDANGNVSITDTDVDNGTTDNCTPTNELQFSLDITDFTCADLGDNTVTLTVTDNDGNFAEAQAIVTVEDVTNPTVVTQSITIQLDATGTASISASDIDNGSSDNCSVATLSLDITEFTCADLGDNTVTLTVLDPSGNSASETAIVTVEDAIAPTVVTQNITIQVDASGAASITADDLDNGSTDNCSIANLSIDVSDFTCSDLGDNTVTLTVLDPSGNSASETATVTVEDTIAPTVVTQDITVQLDASGVVSILPSDIDNGSNDNCSIASLSLDISDFSCSEIGENTVKLTALDGSGNEGSQTAIVTVVDDINPTITCPSGFTVETTGDFILPDYVLEGDVIVSDNCGFTVEQTPTPGTNLSDGDYEITFVITDDYGNTETCFFDLKVEDTTLGVNVFELSDNTITLFPNPTGNILNIKNNSQLNLLSLEIYDVTGKLVNVLDLKSMNDTIQIALQDYANGVYIVRINAENNSLTKRIIKQ